MKRVLIVGGGFAGSLIAKKLQHDFKVTLVDTKEYFEYKPGILRLTVNPSIEKSLKVLHSNYLSKAQIIVGKMTKLTKTYGIVNGKRIHFDYAVIASGATYNPFLKNPRVISAADLESLRAHLDETAKAQRVLVIGGGAVGVELAAELCTKTNVTLVHGNTRLLERNAPKTSMYAKRYLENHGVSLMFDELIASYHDGSFFTRKGTRVEADIAFLCTGLSLNAGYLEDAFGTALDKRKAVIVNEFLQVSNAKNIFAAGDVTNVIEEKTAQAAEKQAAIVVENIKRFNANKSLLTYRSKKRPMIISLGKWSGIMQYGSLVLTGLFPAMAKKVVEMKSLFKR